MMHGVYFHQFSEWCIAILHVCKRYALNSISNELIMYIVKIQLDGMDLATIIRKYSQPTYFNICRQYISAYLPLVSHHFCNSRLQAHPYGIIWSQTLRYLCLTAFKSKTTTENYIQTFPWNESIKRLTNKNIQTDLFPFLFKCAV